MRPHGGLMVRPSAEERDTTTRDQVAASVHSHVVTFGTCAIDAR